jgi:hypothetical protein
MTRGDRAEEQSAMSTPSAAEQLARGAPGPTSTTPARSKSDRKERAPRYGTADHTHQQQQQPVTTPDLAAHGVRRQRGYTPPRIRPPINHPPTRLSNSAEPYTAATSHRCAHAEAERPTMRSPTERAHDAWARAYLAATYRRDQDAMLVLLSQIHSAGQFWDLLDAVGSASRDVIEAFTTADNAAEVLARQLVQAALDDTALP